MTLGVETPGPDPAFFAFREGTLQIAAVPFAE